MPDAEHALRRMASVVAILVAATLLSVDALAQTKPALIRDSDEPGRNPWRHLAQISQTVANCGPSIDQCDVDFGVVPAGKRLPITYASAVFFMAAGGTSPLVAVSTDGIDPIILPLPQSDGSLRHIAASPVQYCVEAGTTPRVTVQGFFLQSGSNLTASLVGYYINLP